VRFNAQTDRIYLGGATTRVRDTAAGRSVPIAKNGSETTVVGNRWIDKAANLPDFGDDQWKRMVCVEVSNIRDTTVGFVPGKSHTVTAIFELTPSARTVTQRSTTA
jgi:glucose-6-phosphate 1-epimerase